MMRLCDLMMAQANDTVRDKACPTNTLKCRYTHDEITVCSLASYIGISMQWDLLISPHSIGTPWACKGVRLHTSEGWNVVVAEFLVFVSYPAWIVSWACAIKTFPSRSPPWRVRDHRGYVIRCILHVTWPGLAWPDLRVVPQGAADTLTW